MGNKSRCNKAKLKLLHFFVGILTMRLTFFRNTLFEDQNWSQLIYANRSFLLMINQKSVSHKQTISDFHIEIILSIALINSIKLRELNSKSYGFTHTVSFQNQNQRTGSKRLLIPPPPFGPKRAHCGYFCSVWKHLLNRENAD